VFGLILRQSGVPVVIGAAVGCMAASALGAMLGGLLFDVRPHDAGVMTMAAVAVLTAGFAAAAIAARRGLHLDPAEALRGD
jgi:hypothetical protein